MLSILFFAPNNLCDNSMKERERKEMKNKKNNEETIEKMR